MKTSTSWQWEEVIDKAVETFGKVTGEQLRQVLDINVVGVFKGMQVAAKAMKEAGNGGSIVNLSSSSGLVGSVQVASYVTSKFAIRGMTKAAALEWAEDNIRVNSVHPGGIKTNIEVFDAVKKATPLGRLAEAEEVANLIVYLLSKDASFSTGSEFVVDGGFTAQ